MEQNFSDEIKKLSYDYYNRNLSFEEYRSLRDQLIDKMDREFNGVSQDYQNGE
jgi:ubiquinone/menaquinone biosynthesis C-methylase UbiE